MRKRRSLKGLSGSPKSHAEKALKSYEAFFKTKNPEDPYSSYESDMKSGDCRRALRALIWKEQLYQAAKIHYSEYIYSRSKGKNQASAKPVLDKDASWQMSEYEQRADRSLMDYEQDFASKCLVGYTKK